MREMNQQSDTTPVPALPLPTLVGAQPLTPEALAIIDALALRHEAAGGFLMTLVNAAGGKLENGLEKLPDAVKDRLEAVTRFALARSYGLARRTAPAALPGLGGRTHRAVATVSGALGGMGGLPTALIELPVTITVLFRSLQQIAARHGFDPRDEAILAECLRVFASGGPMAEDDGVNTSFLSARIALNGVTLHRLIAMVAPPLAVLVGQKLAAQTVPVLGATAGASINFAFSGYYQEMAHVYFGLLRLAQDHDPQEVERAFRARIGQRRLS